jgi:ABC-type lipoprotein export system ATPase subunit
VTASRFYKTDLQMQTPVDRFHWKGPERILPGSTSEHRKEVAESYIRGCYEAGLEIIAITEHNLAPSDSPSLIPELEAAIELLRKEYNYRIILFPGFEVAVTIGSGVHALCIFEPGTPVNTLSEKLAVLGLSEGNRFKDKQAQPVPPAAGLTQDKFIQTIQNDPAHPGLIILAHADSNSGVLDSKTITKSWSQGVIRDERFLCIELPRPRAHYEAGNSSLLKSILLNEDPNYKRRHPIAAICSSDNKRIEKNGDEKNYIGARHTWMRLGAPTIEGLRQVFLDHESRIRFGEENPNEGYNHPTIKSMEIKDAKFVGDQTLTFSPNLNVIIGGSGTGKSTIVNYLRMNLDQAQDVNGQDVKDNYSRSLDTVSPHTIVTTCARLQLTELTSHSVGQEAGTVSSPHAHLNGMNINQVFPVRFYGQREIYNIAQSHAATIELVDDLRRAEIDSLARQEETERAVYAAHNQTASQVPPLRAQIATVSAEKVRLESIRDLVEKAAAPFKKWAVADSRLGSLDKTLAAVAGIILDSPPVPGQLARLSANSSDDTDLSVITDNLSSAVDKYQSALAAAGRQLLDDVEVIKKRDQYVSVQKAAIRAQGEMESAKSDLEDKGIEYESSLRAQESLGSLDEELEGLQERLAGAEEAEVERTNSLARLMTIWEKQHETREVAVEQLGDAVPKTAKNTPFIAVEVLKHGDSEAFQRIVASLLRDRRKVSDEQWNTFVSAVHAAADGDSPSKVFADWLDAFDEDESPQGAEAIEPKLRKKLAEMIGPADRHTIRAARVPDRATVALYRQDGSLAGTLEGGLSVGQKCTAILAILLALDDVPAVIDQPEDEIDNEFTFREMVPLLRKVKERRQLIIVTHDPNIPVNADAEMIYSLAAVDGRGVTKMVRGKEAVGSIDHIHVREAVEEIMEGSEKAFRRRFVKYGF